MKNELLILKTKELIKGFTKFKPAHEALKYEGLQVSHEDFKPIYKQAFFEVKKEIGAQVFKNSKNSLDLLTYTEKLDDLLLSCENFGDDDRLVLFDDKLLNFQGFTADNYFNLNKKVLPKFKPLFEQYRETLDYRYILVYGAAGSGKSYSLAQLLAWNMLTLNEYCVLCCRYSYNAIATSIFAELESVINDFGLADDFEFRRSPLMIFCNKTRSQAIFKGVAEVEKLKSLRGKWAGINEIFIEEATELKSISDLLILDGRMRGKNVLLQNETKKPQHIFLVFNPASKNHWIYNTFFEEEGFSDKIISLSKKSLKIHLTAFDNPYLNAQTLQSLKDTEKISPNHYTNYFLGEWADAGNEYYIAQRQLLNDIYNYANDVPTYEAPVVAGLDIANGGLDKSAVVVRKGNRVLAIFEFDKKIEDVIFNCLEIVNQFSIEILYYDAAGLGAGVAPLIDQNRSRLNPALSLALRPFWFGGAVFRPESRFLNTAIKNKSLFFNFAAQAWWALKFRLDNMKNLIYNDKQNDNMLFSFSRNIEQPILRQTMQELCQIQYTLEHKNLIRINKFGDNQKSPNIADALVMAFANDLNYLGRHD